MEPQNPLDTPVFSKRTIAMFVFLVLVIGLGLYFAMSGTPISAPRDESALSAQEEGVVDPGLPPLSDDAAARAMRTQSANDDLNSISADLETTNTTAVDASIGAI